MKYALKQNSVLQSFISNKSDKSFSSAYLLYSTRSLKTMILLVLNSVVAILKKVRGNL